MQPSRPDMPGVPAPGLGGSWVPSRPDLTPPQPRKPRVLAAFVAVALALSSVGAGAALLLVSPSEKGASGSDSYRFLSKAGPGGSPTRWNPCEPIRYVVNLGDAPEDVLDEVHEAARRISEATGIDLVFEGITDEKLTQYRAGYLPSLYPDRWAPVLIAWVDAEESGIRFERRHRTAVAVASPVPHYWEGGAAYVSGWIAVNEEIQLSGWGPEAVGPILLHELGHIAGLGHIRDATQIMAPALGVTDLGSGDRAGLEALGREQGCLDVPGPP